MRNHNGVLAFYGAFELKRSYQKNMSLGVLFALVLHFLIIGGVIFYQSISPKSEQIPVRVIHIKDHLKVLPPPPPIRPKGNQIDGKTTKVISVPIGPPEPVPDSETTLESTIRTQKELGLLEKTISDVIIAGDEDSIVFDKREEVLSVDEFVPHEVDPKMIKETVPTYPELALRAGREGTVWVSVFVDKQGKVKAAKIAKSSGTNAGLEEAALEVAFKNEFRPGLANNEPIACWATYKVVFKLK